MNSILLCFSALFLAYSLTSAQDSCSNALQKCTPTITGAESKETLCSILRSLLDCGKNVAANNGACTSQQLVGVQNAIDLYYKQLKTAGCSGAGTLMTSLLLCLGLSGVAYFLTALK